MRLSTIVNDISVEIDLSGVTDSAYKTVGRLLDKDLRRPTVKNRDAINKAFLYALRECPNANPSDLWHHVVYRQYCTILIRYRPLNPLQSWVRASGDALEMAVEHLYAPILAPHRIKIVALTSRPQRRRVLEEMGIGTEVGDSKLDIALYTELQVDHWQIFSGVHVKASLAERVSDDVPASRAMMGRGYFSPLWTLDVKSFPPPHGDLINRGELGRPTAPSEKRKYIEEHGDFDGCYTANSRTVPSIVQTASRKRIYRLDLPTQPDKFAQDVIARATTWRLRKR